VKYLLNPTFTYYQYMTFQKDVPQHTWHVTYSGGIGRGEIPLVYGA